MMKDYFLLGICTFILFFTSFYSFITSLVDLPPFFSFSLLQPDTLLVVGHTMFSLDTTGLLIDCLFPPTFFLLFFFLYFMGGLHGAFTMLHDLSWQAGDYWDGTVRYGN